MNQPHYTPDTYEPIKIIEHYGFSFGKGNIIKYVLRSGKKEGNSELQDMKKAKYYLDREIEKLECPKDKSE